MKKMIIFLLICVLTILCFLGFNKLKEDKTYENSKVSNDSSDEIIKVMENVYLDYVQEIHLDPEKYLDKTIEIEGMFTSKYDEVENKTNNYVYRLSDDTHYHDDEKHTEEVMSGFAFIFDGEVPRENDWIKVTGVLKKQDDDIIINATSVDIMKSRGLEKVTTFY